ncbi:unnamed protein product [Symbiodinium natans]|uniref:CENP-V/GFA domain-containing protein n=1 Tax=Symbiodinium natans TaxID=878477 RepID=A0A812VB82_9DINO|nr:unnamed protein product [Symbiodinium natans]
MPMIVGVGAAVTTLLVLRALRRRLSPVVTSKLACRCGKIQGEISAIRQDSIRIHCYCGDCREYAKFIASLGEQGDTTIGEYGDSRLVQVCKSALKITQGHELIKLARKAAKPDGKGQLIMHRYYASCCSVPLYNTVDFLGFVGVFTDFLDEHCMEYAGPIRMFPEEALGAPPNPEADVSFPDLFWKQLRYLWWRKCGPFDYTQEPVYWASASDTKKDD